MDVEAQAPIAAKAEQRMRIVSRIVRLLLREDPEDRRAIFVAVESVLFPEDAS